MSQTNAFKEIEAEGTLPKYFRNAELFSKPKEIKIPEEKIQNKLPDNVCTKIFVETPN